MRDRGRWRPPPRPLGDGGLPPLRPLAGEEAWRREGPPWRLGGALALALLALFFAINALQVTGRTAGVRIQERALASLTELDELLPRVYQEWREEALATTRPSLPVPAYPIPVQISRADILSLSAEELGRLVLAEAASRIYEDGWGVVAEGGASQPGGFSPAGLVRRGLGLIGDDLHNIFRVMAVAAGLAVVALAALLIRFGAGFERLMVLGAAALAAALPSLLVAAVLRFVLGALADGQGDPFASALLALGRDIMGMPIRNYLIFGLAGLALVVISLALARLAAARQLSQPPATVGEGDGSVYR